MVSNFQFTFNARFLALLPNTLISGRALKSWFSVGLNHAKLFRAASFGDRSCFDATRQQMAAFKQYFTLHMWPFLARRDNFTRKTSNQHCSSSLWSFYVPISVLLTSGRLLLNVSAARHKIPILQVNIATVLAPETAIWD